MFFLRPVFWYFLGAMSKELNLHIESDKEMDQVIIIKHTSQQLFSPFLRLSHYLPCRVARLS